MFLLMNTKPFSSQSESEEQWRSPPTREQTNKQKKLQRFNQSLTRWAEKESVSLLDVVSVSGFIKPPVRDIRFAVTRWHPRFQRAAGEASCPGGEGQKPAPSGHYLVYEGSPASSAYGETSSDPEETIETFLETVLGEELLQHVWNDL